MDLNSKVTQLEDEIKVLKKEIQAVLLDLRENMLNRENPFSPQPLTAPMVISTSVSAPAAAVEDKKEPAVEEKPRETPPAKEEVELPLAITGAFEADEAVEMPRKKDLKPLDSDMEELVLAWKPAEDSEKGACLPGSKNTTDNKSDKNVLESITSLVDWVDTSIARLGLERTQAILDISEMMGHLSPEMKAILVKFMHPGPEPVEKVSFKEYMASLIELASLLGKKNDPNNVLFYTLYHGMYSMTEGKEKHG
jgi:archaellum component FlaD/FlaE